MKREYNIIIEKDEEGYYIGSVPELKGCHSQAKSMDELAFLRGKFSTAKFSKTRVLPKAFSEK